LEAGDTLVYIKLPSDELLLDATGIPVTSKPHRVHSSKLLATGSAKFRELLSNEIKQRRMRARNGFASKATLPPGIKYVLDLTPPDEGDEAVLLISELSCSAGICHWYTSEQRCGTHHDRVGGKDEVTKPVLDEETGGDIVDTVVPLPHDDELQENLVAPTPRCQTLEQKEEATLQRVLQQSKYEALAAPKAHKQFDPDAKDRKLQVQKVEEYCPIRHRAGIERLLRVIEGRDPGLDSAPKVWTLFAVAKYFECSEVVVSLNISYLSSILLTSAA
jgi:hypothetical protein